MATSQPVIKAAELLRRSVLPDDPAVTVRLVSYFHRQVYAAAGSASFTFFNASKSKYTTNLPKPNEIPGGHILFARALRARVVPNETFATSAAAVAAATYIASTDPTTNAEQLLHIYNNGAWEFKVSGRPIADGYGLNKLAAGSSPIVNAALATTATTTTMGVSNVQNGEPRYDNGWIFTPAAIITEGISFECNVEFQTALPLTNAGTFEMVLEGVLIGPANS